MKLDKIKFANLVAYIIGLRPEFDIDMYQLDTLTDIDVTPVEVPGKANPVDLNELMRLMAGGSKHGQVATKIEAIKMYRSITGLGLKESKDAVEAYWVSKPDEPA